MTEPLYRIGEAARLLELETYVLRFWESEFPQLEPLRTPKGQRLYTSTHLELLRRVKTLLYEDGLTIEGARKILTREGDSEAEGLLASAEVTEVLEATKVVRPGKPARFVQGTLLPKPTPTVLDVSSRRFLQDLRTELAALLELSRTGALTNALHSTPNSDEEPPA